MELAVYGNIKTSGNLNNENFEFCNFHEGSYNCVLIRKIKKYKIVSTEERRDVFCVDVEYMSTRLSANEPFRIYKCYVIQLKGLARACDRLTISEMISGN